MRRYERNRYWWVKEKNDMALVLIAITMILQLHIKGCVGCLETERIGLLQLKSYLNSLLPSPQEEGILESWSDADPKSDCCLWERINCSDAIGGHLVDLSLDYILPDEYFSRDAPLPLNLSLLHSFPQLKNFIFSYNGINHLFDPIHGYKSFQRLQNLKTLDFSYNRLNNSVLPFLSSARSLRTLNLLQNRMEGVFPPNGLLNLRELEVLDLSYNSINDVEACDGEKNKNKRGKISECVGAGLRTTKLKTLDLSFNKFSEAARLKGLVHLVELKVLRLVGNDFKDTRSIEVLKDMPKLQELDLILNNFTDLDSLGLVIPTSLQVLSLADNQLSSTPKGYSNFCALMNLQELDLRFNALTSMPYCLGNLSRLRTLDLSDNHLNGNMSDFVSRLPSALEYLSLLGSNFNDSFLFNSLANHTRLTVFKLSSNVGMIQDMTESSWVPLFRLKRLELQNVILGSTIPGFLIHQYDLCYIDLSYNELTGAFPTWLVQNNTRLRTLLLNNNSLTKLQLPRLVHGLRIFDISSNMIYDSVQEDLGIVFPELRYMNFASNHFHGTIPSSMGEMKSLDFLDMSSNSLYGQLPKTFLSGCYSLRFLKLSNNQFHGEIFSEHANLTGLPWLYLEGNGFNGSLGKGLLNLKDLFVFDISENSISGKLPLWIGRMSSLSYLYMRGNQLKGPFPHQLQSLSRLHVIDMSQNSLYGSIPSNVNFSSLKELRLQSNELMGSIPGSLFKASYIEVLDLRNNNFSGMILNTIGKVSYLRVLLLRNNSFQSHIPEKICQLSQVGILDLSHNKFKGHIPSCLGNMSFGAEGNGSFVEPDIFSDKVDGNTMFVDDTVLQNCWYASHLNFGHSVSISYQPKPAEEVDFLTKSRYEAYQDDIIYNMYGLDMSSNQLSGEIPVEIGNLKNIRSLNLSNNYLTSSIPDSISKLKDLESLDLSNNLLDGNIPPQLAGLDSLGYFNVSFNNLSGEIPLNGHLLTFGKMSYIGNAYLCGLPINKGCNPVPKPSEEEGGGVIDMVWFYWTCGAVYISTLLALFAFLCIDSRWSREWFYWVDLSVHHLQRFKDRFVSN